MDYKWCVCDMDGTLLNSEGLISKENELALKNLEKKGVEIIIASGRTDLMMKSFIRQLKLRGHIICCNGGLVKKIETGEVVYSKAIDKDTADVIIKYCFENSVNFLVYTENRVYSNINNPRAKHFEDLNEKLPHDLHTPIEYIEYDYKYIFAEIDVFKILIVEKDEKRKDFYAHHFSEFTNLAVVSSAEGLLDICASNISKGSALKALSKKLSVNLDQVIAFGDNYNDLDMFEIVGLPIAMENAVQEIKSAAKFITCSNDKSGVAYAIYNIILKYHTNIVEI